MIIKIYIIISLCLLFRSAYAQSPKVEDILQQIEQNNTELKAFQSFMAGQELLNKSTNNLPNTQLTGYYLPFGEHEGPDYYEYEISQRIEFPTVYSARNKWNTLKAEQLQTRFEKKRQDLLLKAKQSLISLFILQKQRRIEVKRSQQSKEAFETVEKRFKNQQVSRLEYNKARLVWLHEQFVVDQLDTEIHNQITGLQNLNGGKTLVIGDLQLDEPFQLPPLDSLWAEKLENDPELLKLKSLEATALQNVQLEKNKALPDLALGYNYQGISGNNYSGFYGGLSIPLWSSKNKVRAAQAEYEYQQSNTKVAQQQVYVQFQQTYNQYQLLFEKYMEYRNTLDTFNTEDLLFKAYNAGEYSFLDFYTEVQFYRDATDKMLEMEKQLQLLKAELLKHRL